MHEGKVYLEQFSATRLRNPTILETAQRVIPRPDAELGRIFESTDKAPTHLSVLLKSGAHYELHVDYPRGCPQSPATRAELEAKFEALTAPVLPAAQRVKEAFFALEEVSHIGDVMALLCRQES